MMQLTASVCPGCGVSQDVDFLELKQGQLVSLLSESHENLLLQVP